jgi:hypothetical protein
MNVPVRKAWTQEEFLSWVATQPIRYEFDGVQPVAMTGGSLAAGAIQRNLGRSCPPGFAGSVASPMGQTSALPQWAPPCVIRMH